MSIKVAIIGGSGYGGSELLRILLFHRQVEIVLVTANEHAGKPIVDLNRNLRGMTDLVFQPLTFDASDAKSISRLNPDVAFLALPHGQAMEIAPQLGSNLKVIDLSGDFRISESEVFEKFYGFAQSAPTLQRRFVYGLTEINREVIAGTRLIANPGCFATATLLGLAPIVAAGIISGRVVVDAKTGSSGSGAKAATNTHHPQRMNSFYAYKPFTHQHLPEIEQELAKIGAWKNDLVFITHSLPVSRGIFASIYVETTHQLTLVEARQIYKNFYRDSFFIRLVEGSPDINWVKTTNFCDIGLAVDGRQLVIFTAIDNLVKGAAGQAVQNMNLMCGFDEKTGLLLTGSNP
ncbi:MAG: N-acetyl-gamma-glutamyl-phosphate reductase [Pyrinomonadaceae bacterium]